MKTEYHDLSLKVGAKLFQGIRDAGRRGVYRLLVGGAADQEGTGEQVVHPIEIVWAATPTKRSGLMQPITRAEVRSLEDYELRGRTSASTCAA